MATILNIETATKSCSVCLAKDGSILSLIETDGEYSHSENIAVFTQKVLADAGITVNELNAIAVSEGPGSYTGLRIGTSFAKGLCFSLSAPLIATSTLKALAFSPLVNEEIQKLINKNAPTSISLCPMIDARRMEVYAAIFDGEYNALRRVSADIIDAFSYSEFLEKGLVLFFGDGSAKCKEVLGKHPNAIFIDNVAASASTMIEISETKFNSGLFENTAYFEPNYLKEFRTTIAKKML